MGEENEILFGGVARSVNQVDSDIMVELKLPWSRWGGRGHRGSLAIFSTGFTEELVRGWQVRRGCFCARWSKSRPEL